MKDKTDTVFMVEEVETGHYRISKSQNYMGKLMLAGMDFATLLLEGETKFWHLGTEYKVSFIDDLKLTDVTFEGTFKEGNA